MSQGRGGHAELLRSPRPRFLKTVVNHGAVSRMFDTSFLAVSTCVPLLMTRISTPLPGERAMGGGSSEGSTMLMVLLCKIPILAIGVVNLPRIMLPAKSSLQNCPKQCSEVLTYFPFEVTYNYANQHPDCHRPLLGEDSRAVPCSQNLRSYKLLL